MPELHPHPHLLCVALLATASGTSEAALGCDGLMAGGSYLQDTSRCWVNEINQRFNGKLDKCDSDDGSHNAYDKSDCEDTAANINNSPEYTGPDLGCNFDWDSVFDDNDYFLKFDSPGECFEGAKKLEDLLAPPPTTTITVTTTITAVPTTTTTTTTTTTSRTEITSTASSTSSSTTSSSSSSSVTGATTITTTTSYDATATVSSSSTVASFADGSSAASTTASAQRSLQAVDQTQGELNQQERRTRDSDAPLSGATIAVIVMATLAAVGAVAAAYVKQRATQRRDANPIGAAAATAVYANPGFRAGSGGPQYLAPDSSQPGRYDAAANDQSSKYAVPGSGPTPALDADGYVVDGYKSSDLGRRTNLLKDHNGYVVDDFNPDELGRRATVNVGAKQALGGATTIYAIPVADEERDAVLTNLTYGQAAPTGPALRSNRKHNTSVYDGFDESSCAQGGGEC